MMIYQHKHYICKKNKKHIRHIRKNITYFALTVKMSFRNALKRLPPLTHHYCCCLMLQIEEISGAIKTVV